MSEVKLNLIDSDTILAGEIHGSIADACIAALAAEPETIAELQAALLRYQKGEDGFNWFRQRSEIDGQPYDAGIVIIDLAGRVAAAESSYCQPHPEGSVQYHDGFAATDVSVPYRLPDDWLFVNSVEAYRWAAERRRQQRTENPPFDARAVLYGKPLLEFVVNACSGLKSATAAQSITAGSDPDEPPLHQDIVRIHADWLLTPRPELRDQSPREVLLAKQDFIDFDLHTRSLQWSCLGEGPPCLSPDSFAYRFAGFGTHEWVVYYDLVRHLLRQALELASADAEISANQIDQIKNEWLEQSDREYDERTPANIIQNERRRLPEAMTPSQIMIDEDCECCRMMAMEAEMGLGPTFWHLDGSHMEEEFAFSSCKTIEEWEAENRRREECYQQFQLEWAERDARRRAEMREMDEELMREEMNPF